MGAAWEMGGKEILIGKAGRRETTRGKWEMERVKGREVGEGRKEAGK